LRLQFPGKSRGIDLVASVADNNLPFACEPPFFQMEALGKAEIDPRLAVSIPDSLSLAPAMRTVKSNERVMSRH
jgi:hypothetical protein